MSQIIPLFKRIAQNNRENPGDGRLEKFFMFKFGNKTFVIPVVDITEVAIPGAIVSVLGEPYLVGVVNIRGTVVPVVNLRDRINLDKNYVIDENSRLLLLTIKAGVYVGFIADKIEYRFKEGIVEPLPSEDRLGKKSFRYAVIENQKYPVFFVDAWLEPKEFEAIVKIADEYK
ncbi:MAG: chemotaxis protein CheW [Lachnospiraceae bacterium]|nr:chemotaxis protein CheW [Lachnospiraceae bacterium]